MFIATLRQHGADRLTAVVPYLAYARKDRLTKPWDPLTLRYVAQLFEAVGMDQIVALAVHNVAAFQNAFRAQTQHLDAHRAFDEVAEKYSAMGPLVIASPDPGGVKRAQLWQDALREHVGLCPGFAMVDKRRSAGVVSGGRIVAGDVKDATVLLFDDLISTGETMQRAAVALREAGASRVVACAAHGLFIDPAAQVLLDACIDEVVVSDSVLPFRIPSDGALRRKLRVVSCVPLVAEAISHSHGSWRR
jgi:ribose-phosphate pyrophosphokinase